MKLNNQKFHSFMFETVRRNLQEHNILYLKAKTLVIIMSRFLVRRSLMNISIEICLNIIQFIHFFIFLEMDITTFI
ncbi:hypothetical protein BpHYR1_038100 [Brachionus plicatilis]|uniref:Uncharacterized protein n=1 Tax=Brachionus plicatilis TaxID=10195 RepID=A0A3M7Q3P4_BRAPC|nr:hypothetical protein BpHYR1_038100 [Brachionus plicatilis]